MEWIEEQIKKLYALKKEEPLINYSGWTIDEVEALFREALTSAYERGLNDKEKEVMNIIDGLVDLGGDIPFGEFKNKLKLRRNK